MQPPRLDPLTRDIAADTEMSVQPVSALVPFGNPEIRERFAEIPAQPLEEDPQMRPKRGRVMQTLTRIRQRAEPVQPVRCAVPADLASRPSRRLLPRAFGILSQPGDSDAVAPLREAQRASGLGSVGVEAKDPFGPTSSHQFRCYFK